MFLYLMLNKPNYRKSQLNQYLSTQIQLNIKNETLNEGKNMHSSIWYQSNGFQKIFGPRGVSLTRFGCNLCVVVKF